jgi:hypothetical protein
MTVLRQRMLEDMVRRESLRRFSSRVTESWGCAMQRGSYLAAAGDLDTSVRSSHVNGPSARFV